MELEDIIETVKNRLSEKRFFHSRCVMERAVEIAKKFGYDVATAAKVGIAHDIAKEIPAEEKIKYVKENNIAIEEIELENPTLLHAKIGQDIAIKELGFTKEMARAIRAHTTGLENMSLLDKIIFVADRTSAERGFKDIDYINELLQKNIDEAVLAILQQTLDYLKGKKQDIDQHTVETYNYYKHLLGREDDE